MQPTQNRLLVRVEEVPVPEGATPVKANTMMKAEVLLAGPSVQNTDIRKGAKVAFSPYGFDEVFIDGEKLVIISEDLILATLK